MEDLKTLVLAARDVNGVSLEAECYSIVALCSESVQPLVTEAIKGGFDSIEKLYICSAQKKLESVPCKSSLFLVKMMNITTHNSCPQV